MKPIQVAWVILLTFGLTSSAVAEPNRPLGESIMVTTTVADAAVPTPKARQSAFLAKQVLTTQALAPKMDASQPPIVLDPPIVAGTIDEDPGPRNSGHSRRSTAAPNQSRKKQGLFDKLFRRNHSTR